MYLFSHAVHFGVNSSVSNYLLAKYTHSTAKSRSYFTTLSHAWGNHFCNLERKIHVLQKYNQIIEEFCTVRSQIWIYLFIRGNVNVFSICLHIRPIKIGISPLHAEMWQFLSLFYPALASIIKTRLASKNRRIDDKGPLL